MDIQPAEFLNVQMHLASDSAGPPSHDSSSPSTSPNSVNTPTIMELLQTTFLQYPDGNNFINPEFITTTPITFQNGLEVHVPIPVPIPAPAPAPIPVLVLVPWPVIQEDHFLNISPSLVLHGDVSRVQLQS